MELRKKIFIWKIFSIYLCIWNVAFFLKLFLKALCVVTPPPRVKTLE